MEKLRRKKRVSYDLECSFLENRNVNKAFLKIVAVLLLVSINWNGILAIGLTYSYFTDIEGNTGNIYKTGSLDFSLESLGDVSLNIGLLSPAVRRVDVFNDGSLPFQYIVEAVNPNGSLCDYLEVEAKLNGVTTYTSSLNSFSLIPSVIFTNPSQWQFVITFQGDGNNHIGENCQFNFNFKGWQDNILDFNSSGFNDQESIFTTITLREEKTVVLNEILPNPSGDDCSLTGVEGEWVELYNNSDIAMDLTGWYIEDSTQNRITISSSNTLFNSAVIQPSGWLVVLVNGCFLDDEGDSVNFYHYAGKLVDSYSYLGGTPEDKSHARFPDGIGTWFDPIPTPGTANKLFEPEPERVSLISETPEPILEVTTPADTGIFGEAMPSDDEVTPEPEVQPETPEPQPEADPLREDILETTAPSDVDIIPEPEPEPEEVVIKEELIIKESASVESFGETMEENNDEENTE